jgi:hypothetical protein
VIVHECVASSALSVLSKLNTGLFGVDVSTDKNAEQPALTVYDLGPQIPAPASTALYVGV